MMAFLYQSGSAALASAAIVAGVGRFALGFFVSLVFSAGRLFIGGAPRVVEVAVFEVALVGDGAAVAAGVKVAILKVALVAEAAVAGDHDVRGRLGVIENPQRPPAMPGVIL